MPSFRGEKINEEIKRDLSMILRNIKDPRVPELISVTKVEVTKDLKHAKAYISVVGDEKTKKDAINGLVNANGYIRSELSSRVDLRTTPHFSFIIDNSIEYGNHIMGLINEIKEKENK